VILGEGAGTGSSGPPDRHLSAVGWIFKWKEMTTDDEQTNKRLEEIGPRSMNWRHPSVSRRIANERTGLKGTIM